MTTQIQPAKSLRNLAEEWLSYNRKGDIAGIEILPQQTAYGLVVWFYFEDTFQDLPYSLTVPMVKELLEGKNPKKVKNEYLKLKPVDAPISTGEAGNETKQLPLE